MYNKNHIMEFDLIGMSNSEIISDMGKYLKNYRLRKNKTQEELAMNSGIKRETIARIENGSNFTIGTFIQLLRHLNALDSIIDFFKPIDIISPSMYMKMQKKSRKRVKHSKIELIKAKTINKNQSK